jgi:sugar phosphate isomerase/epimerase
MFPGESGLIDAAALLNRLAQHGYDGPVTPLAHPSRFAGMKRDAVARLAGQTLDAVWKQAGLSAAGKIVTSVK